ncbi:heat shock protein 90 [Hordeum vulgare]|nr:heat shock protein 90 [Hordeum vulgare]
MHTLGQQFFYGQAPAAMMPPQVIYFTDPVDRASCNTSWTMRTRLHNVSKEGPKLGKDSKLKDLKESFATGGRRPWTRRASTQ